MEKVYVNKENNVVKTEFSAESALIEQDGNPFDFALLFNDGRGLDVELVDTDAIYSTVPVLTLDAYRSLHKDIRHLMSIHLKNMWEIHSILLSNKSWLLDEVGNFKPYFDNDGCYQVDADTLKVIISAYNLDNELPDSKTDKRRRNLKV